MDKITLASFLEKGKRRNNFFTYAMVKKSHFDPKSLLQSSLYMFSLHQSTVYGELVKHILHHIQFCSIYLKKKKEILHHILHLNEICCDLLFNLKKYLFT
jgi:hypothetical protein